VSSKGPAAETWTGKIRSMLLDTLEVEPRACAGFHAGGCFRRAVNGKEYGAALPRRKGAEQVTFGL
jgi:hypothetical protein